MGVAEFRAAMERYFLDCAGELAREEDGRPLLKNGKACYVQPPSPPSAAGLAVALGCDSLEALRAWEARGAGYAEALARARLRLEGYAVERLFDHEGYKGAIFALAHECGWLGWPQAAAGVAADEADEEQVASGVLILPERGLAELEGEEQPGAGDEDPLEAAGEAAGFSGPAGV